MTRKIILFVYTVLAASHFALAQTQHTLGSCSPAIQGVTGNVSVTCITGDNRIRVAKFEENIDEDRGERFSDFVMKNLDKIVKIDIMTDMSEQLYIPQEKTVNGLTGGSIAVTSDPKCRDVVQCGGTIIYFNDFEKPTTVYPYHGNWKASGYYHVGCGGFAMGQVEYCLRPIDDKEIAISSKYETE
jgi:hypothetical protein